jgi:hypothetical protein
LQLGECIFGENYRWFLEELGKQNITLLQQNTEWKGEPA